jgi:hypothetical protein
VATLERGELDRVGQQMARDRGLTYTPRTHIVSPLLMSGALRTLTRAAVRDGPQLFALTLLIEKATLALSSFLERESE